MTSSRPDRTWLVALAAAAWGLDGLLREPLSTALAAGTVVLWEHLIVLIVVAVFVPSAIRAYRRCDVRTKVAVATIGAGASALATALFTRAFALAARNGDYITPLVLQKLQPLIAVGLAVTLLRERLRARFLLHALPALAGAWLLAFPRPLHVAISTAVVALLAVGAAALWAAGTVLGRMVSSTIGWRDLTVLRYCWGLPAALTVVWTTGAPLIPAVTDLPALTALALIPGLIALSLYYIGLRTTAAARATFAELAFPATAALVGGVFLNTHLANTQWLGLAIVITAITALSWHERLSQPEVIPAPGRLLAEKMQYYASKPSP